MKQDVNTMRPRHNYTFDDIVDPLKRNPFGYKIVHRHYNLVFYVNRLGQKFCREGHDDNIKLLGLSQYDWKKDDYRLTRPNAYLRDKDKHGPGLFYVPENLTGEIVTHEGEVYYVCNDLEFEIDPDLKFKTVSSFMLESSDLLNYVNTCPLPEGYVLNYMENRYTPSRVCLLLLLDGYPECKDFVEEFDCNTKRLGQKYRDDCEALFPNAVKHNYVAFQILEWSSKLNEYVGEWKCVLDQRNIPSLVDGLSMALSPKQTAALHVVHDAIQAASRCLWIKHLSIDTVNGKDKLTVLLRNEHPYKLHDATIEIENYSMDKLRKRIDDSLGSVFKT